jgi:hypothetical protein
VIIFGSVRFLSKKSNQTGFKKKFKTKPKSVQTDRFWFGLLILEQKPVISSLTQFFPGLARFFWFGFGSVQFGFFSFKLIKPN